MDFAHKYIKNEFKQDLKSKVGMYIHFINSHECNVVVEVSREGCKIR